jgi:hypothetical protein
MNKKFFIVTDERCGCTSFTSLFVCCSLKVIHDPQTRTSTRKEFKDFKYVKTNRTNLLLDYCYKNLNINVVKCCYISYSIEEYKELINYCISQNIEIIVFHRKKVNNRALSKCVADELLNYGKYKGTEKPFKININTYKNHIINYYNKCKSILEYIEDKKKNYYYIIFEDFYSNINNIYKFFNYIQLDIINNSLFVKIVKKDYNTFKKNEKIKNKEEIKQFDSSFKLIPNMIWNHENLLYRIIIN